MKNVQIGDKVYCLLYGEGVVRKLETRDNQPIGVEFSKTFGYYSYDGVLHGVPNRTLFYSKPHIEIPLEPVRPLILPNGSVVTPMVPKKMSEYMNQIVYIVDPVHFLNSDPEKPYIPPFMPVEIINESSWEQLQKHALIYPHHGDVDLDVGIHNLIKSHIEALLGIEYPAPF